MISKVSITNMALIRVGADPIQSMAQEIRSAKLANAVFDQLRDEVLRSHPWNFAIKRVSLYPNNNTPEYEYEYEYDVPNDCLRVLGLDDDTIQFVVEDKKILTNSAEIKISYIYRNEDPSTWDSNFANSFAWRLAQELAYAITNSTERADKCEKSYRLSLSEARSYDGVEGITKGLVADIFTRSRL